MSHLVRGLHKSAAAAGRLTAAYSRWVAHSGDVAFEGEMPFGPVVAVTWHGLILVGLGAHTGSRLCPCAFVTPGFRGAAMRGWLAGNRMQAVPLPRTGTGNPAAGLKEMARALDEGRAVAVALDGPRGPARVARPGALWLARLSVAISPLPPAHRSGR